MNFSGIFGKTYHGSVLALAVSMLSCHRVYHQAHSVCLSVHLWALRTYWQHSGLNSPNFHSWFFFFNGYSLLGFCLFVQKIVLTSAKGQLISKRLFDVIVWTKKTTKLRISALASKKRSDQKIKAFYITNEGLFNIII